MDYREDRILIADLLRVMGTMMVLFSHLSITIGPPWSEAVQPYFGIENFYWATWGELGVTIFLVLSGFSLEIRYGQERPRLVDFYLRRIIRIYPIYYLSILVGLAMHIAVSLWGTWIHGKTFIILPNFSAIDLILTLTGFNAFAGNWGGGVGLVELVHWPSHGHVFNLSSVIMVDEAGPIHEHSPAVTGQCCIPCHYGWDGGAIW